MTIRPRLHVPMLRRIVRGVFASLLVLLVTSAAAESKPRKTDRDGDGLSDRYERKVSKTDPRRKDTDRDGLRDRYELRVSKTRPRRKDTDRDGLGDGYEVRRSKTNPRRLDTDRDGLSDGFEVLRMRTNPRKIDTDGDGISDGAAALLRPISAPVGSLPARPETPRKPKLPELGDILPPLVTFRKPTTGQEVSGRLDEASGTCDVQASDAVGVTQVDFFLDGQQINSEYEAPYACTIDTRQYPNGAHTITAKAYDEAGNAGIGMVAVIFDNAPPSDTTAPNTSISGGPSGTTTSTSATFSLSSTESGSTFECKLDSGSWGTCTSPKTYSGLAPGNHALDVRATDAAGNVDATPAERNWTVSPPADSTAPDTSISGGPSGSTTATSASFSFSSTESGSSFECKLDSGSWGSCTSPKAYSGLATGSHTFRVQAKDAAGNTDASPAIRTWTVSAPADTTAPDTSISGGPSGTTTSTSASFSLSSTESGSTFECKLDSGSWGACSSPKAYSSLGTGSHTFNARAKDAAGNSDASPATRTWTVEGAAPPPPPPPPPSGSTNRDIPVSPAGYLGQFNLSSRNYAIANRFVLDQTETIDRWYQTLIAEGTTCVGGRSGYGHGDGGMLWGRIVEVNQTTGLPSSTILAEERVNGCTGWQRVKNEFNLPQNHSTHYFQFPAVTLQANRMYAFLLSNTHSSPGSGGGGDDGGNHLSADLNWAQLSQMGPHGRNNVDPTASGAMYGLDPRETTMWSDNSGGNWEFGNQVGWYQLGSSEGRMWNGAGYRIASSHQNVAHGWPYINWPGEGSATVTMKSSPKAVTITRAGGASSSGSVGTVTVRNTRTGVSGQTSSLSNGVQRGTLNNPVPISVGDSYTITNTGVVDTGDGGKAPVFGLGQRSPFNYSSSGARVSASTDRPMLFATPHPYY